MLYVMDTHVFQCDKEYNKESSLLGFISVVAAFRIAPNDFPSWYLYPVKLLSLECGLDLLMIRIWQNNGMTFL